MPLGTCAECGLRDVLGPGLLEDEAFLCCDCDIELRAYTREERADPANAGRKRGVRAEEKLQSDAGKDGAAGPSPLPASSAAAATTAPGDDLGSPSAPELGLQSVCFDPVAGGDLGPGPPGVSLLSDPEESIFAGVGTRVWPAAEPLALCLAQLCSAGDWAAADSRRGPSGLQPAAARIMPLAPAPRRLVEVGAGCGAVGLWLWQACRPRLAVCLTDLPRLCPLLRVNAERICGLRLAAADDAPGPPAAAPRPGNGGGGGEGRVQVCPLRWGLPEDLADLSLAGGSGDEGWDLVVGSDVCYNEEKVRPLMDTIEALKPVHGAVLSLSLDLLRGPGAEALEARCSEEGWLWRELSRGAGCDGTPVLVAQIVPPSCRRKAKND